MTTEQQTFQQLIKIPNPLGFHARPATQLSKLVKRLETPVFIENSAGRKANAMKMFELLGLALSQNAEVTVSCDNESVLNEIVAAIATGLGDDLTPPTTDTDTEKDKSIWEPQGDYTCYQGVSASEGLVIGKIKHYRQQHFELPDHVGTPAEETTAFRQAIDDARSVIESMKNAAGTTASVDQKAIFDAHLSLLSDQDMIADTITAIAHGENAPKAFKKISDQRMAELAAVDNANIAARATDIRDVRNHVMHALLGTSSDQSLDITEPMILCAEDFTPSDTAKFDPEKVLGMITQLGGPTSHSAIIARGMGMPAVVATGATIKDIPDESTVIIDGTSGRVYANPTPEQITSAQQAQAQLQKAKDKELSRRLEKGQTADGVTVEISANVNQPDKVPQALELGAEGIGLMRTEFLYLESDHIPSEDEQERVYREMANSMNGKPLIIRTLDIGGDKEVDYLGLAHEDNAFLGVRGIRLCFERPDLFLPQLRAICRVAKDYDNIRVMFPMISKCADWTKAKEMLEEVRNNIGAPVFPVGIMIEVPSAALLAPALAKEVDFFSVGTNDLTQYTLAMDRMHPVLATQADALHPSVLNLIHMTTQAAQANGKWVGVCGGAAGEKSAAKLLVGLGVRELSMPAPQIAGVKAALREHTIAELEELAQKALSQSSARDIRAMLH